MLIIKTLITLCGFGLYSSLVIGQSLGAHVHGVATLSTAIEGNAVSIELHSPAANIVGFEHKASTEAEQNAVDNAKHTLSDALALFSFSGSDCVLKHSEVDMSGVAKPKRAENHDHNHGHHHSDDHSHDHGHAEIVASYHLECDNLQAAKSLTVSLFKAFPAIEKIEAQWLTTNKQGAQILTPSNNTLLVK